MKATDTQIHQIAAATRKKNSSNEKKLEKNRTARN